MAAPREADYNSGRGTFGRGADASALGYHPRRPTRLRLVRAAVVPAARESPKDKQQVVRASVLRPLGSSSSARLEPFLVERH